MNIKKLGKIYKNETCIKMLIFNIIIKYGLRNKNSNIWKIIR